MEQQVHPSVDPDNHHNHEQPRFEWETKPGQGRIFLQDQEQEHEQEQRTHGPKVTMTEELLVKLLRHTASDTTGLAQTPGTITSTNPGIMAHSTAFALVKLDVFCATVMMLLFLSTKEIRDGVQISLIALLLINISGAVLDCMFVCDFFELTDNTRPVFYITILAGGAITISAMWYLAGVARGYWLWPSLESVQNVAAAVWSKRTVNRTEYPTLNPPFRFLCYDIHNQCMKDIDSVSATDTGMYFVWDYLQGTGKTYPRLDGVVTQEPFPQDSPAKLFDRVHYEHRLSPLVVGPDESSAGAAVADSGAEEPQPEQGKESAASQSDSVRAFGKAPAGAAAADSGAEEPQPEQGKESAASQSDSVRAFGKAPAA